MGAEAKIKELGITLPSPAKPMGNYVPGVRVGNLLFLSGHGPLRIEGNPSARGKVGRDLSTEDAYKVAREVGINLLGSARAILGSLDKVKRVVKVLGMVNAVVPHADLERTALDWAAKINAKSPTSQRMLKFAFNLIDDGLVGQQVFAAEATRLAYMTDEAAEGRDAFLEKRAPDWTRFPWYY